MQLTNPPKLKKGDTIAIVSPSAGLAKLFPHRVERGIAMLQRAGFKTILTKHALDRKGWVSASPEQRAADIHEAFANSEVKAIICTIGGNYCNQILRYLDFDFIRQNPKIFVGYSDITVLHYALASQAGLRTYYGPCLISEFGEYPEIFSYTLDYFEKALVHDDPIGDILPSREWTDEFLDWFTKEDLTRPRRLRPAQGYVWWREGHATAPIWGGTVPSINHLAGTKYWVPVAGKILFLDLPEGEPGKPFALSWLDSFLGDLENLEVFATIRGLIIGRPYAYTSSEENTFRELIDYYTADYSYPILYNANIGHASPIITLPLGAVVTLNSAQDRFRVEASA